jgi:hypothetical protein
VHYAIKRRGDPGCPPSGLIQELVNVLERRNPVQDSGDMLIIRIAGIAAVK